VGLFGKRCSCLWLKIYPVLTICGNVSNKYPLQRDIFCIEEASLCGYICVAGWLPGWLCEALLLAGLYLGSILGFVWSYLKVGLALYCIVHVLVTMFLVHVLVLYNYSVLKHCAHIRCTHIVCTYSIRSAHVYYCLSSMYSSLCSSSMY
jgi:hypothetical protein